MIRIAAAIAVLWVLAGCATLNENECRAGDWRSIGVEDGARGLGPEQLEKHRKACAEYGISPQQSEWLAGRQEGLRLYCRPANAYRVGRRGRQLAPYCTAEEAADMRPAWDHGRRYHEITQDIAELEREEDRLLFDLSNTNDVIASDAGLLRSSVQSSLLWIRLEIQQLQLRRLRYDSWP